MAAGRSLVIHFKTLNSDVKTMKLKTYSRANFRKIPQIATLNEAERFDIEVVSRVLPFKVNNFVIKNLIDWDAVPDDPMFTLLFPRREMLQPGHYEEIAGLLKKGKDPQVVQEAVERIRLQLNPQPAGQLLHNVVYLDGEVVPGIQHKYRETALFFPSHGQTCHAYCTFCFRWPQFTGMTEFRFSSREVGLLISYVREHPEISDLLFTGGDPLVMSTKDLAGYIKPLLAEKLPNLRRIRIGTKALSYWPYRFLKDADADQLLQLFEKIGKSGIHLAIMAHFNHPRELAPPEVGKAIQRVRNTGAEIRTQSPILNHINNDPDLWAELWDKQADMGCIPYYMFIPRDTGARHYFSVPLVRAWEVFQQAYQKVSGLSRTVRGPSMSAGAGKIQVLGVTEMKGQKVIALRFLQGRDPDWVHRPFFAEYDARAIWINELRPVFGEKRFFFEEKLEALFQEDLNAPTDLDFE